jgi:hypothetical protein
LENRRTFTDEGELRSDFDPVSVPPLNFSALNSDKLRASPERSEGEAQFSGERPKEFAGKFNVFYFDIRHCEKRLF